jgi:DNA polymerase I-like protein with 3'-5' exonuclease and polymerase domains
MVQKGFAYLDAKFPGASRYFQDTVYNISARDGVLITPFGREKHLGSTLVQGDQWKRRNAERQAVNGSIQSPANSVTVRCLNAVNAALEEKIQNGEITEEEALLIITVHDSGLFEVKEEYVEWFEPMLREIANRPVPQLNNYQFTMKVGVGSSWSEAELNAK